MKQHEATEVAEFFERFDDIASPGVRPDMFKVTTRMFTKQVVEKGTFTPKVTVTADFQLALKDRLKGKSNQDVTAILSLGMMLGAALERDIPKDSDEEGAWRNGEFELPIE